MVNRLGLHSTSAADVIDGAGGGGDFPFRFWVKAGIGFSFGAGCVYVLGQALWLVLLYNFPGFVLLRWLKLL